jgi:hypothetical protein
MKIQLMSLATGDALEFSLKELQDTRGEQPTDMDSDDETMQIVEYLRVLY